MSAQLKKILLIIAILIFAISLTQPGFYADKKFDSGKNSFGLLFFGWTGLLFGGAAIAWLANPFIILSWCFFFKKPKTALIFSFLAVLFSASFLLFHSVLRTERPDYSTITSREAGYWIWLTSIVFTLIIAAIASFGPQTPPKNEFVQNPFAKR